MIVGDYRLLRPLGRGGMAEVWLGRHSLTGGSAAVKVLRDGAGATARASLARERRALARLHHPSIVALFDGGPDHLVTSFVDGTDLARRMRAPVSAAEALGIARAIALALDHAHRRGVVHRDVKPSNVLIDVRGDAFLGDFGVASIDGDQADAVGTPAFAAPEQRRGAPVDGAADQFALARTVLAMWLGAPDALDAVRDRALHDVLSRALDADPRRRFSSCAELADALGSLGDREREVATRAPSRRGLASFAWASAAERRESSIVERVDHRVRALAAAGALDRAATERFLARSGYADLGFSIHARTERLGPLDRPDALARVERIVVPLHGLWTDRETWRELAPRIARMNATGLVITPDLLGFGASPLVDEAPSVEVIGPRATFETVRAWLALLGLGEVPTTYVAYSYMSTAILELGDDALRAHESAVVLAPSIPFFDASIRAQLRALRLVAHLGVIHVESYRALVRWLGENLPAYGVLSPADRERMIAMARAVPPLRQARFADAMLAARAPRTHERDRSVVAVTPDDPAFPAVRRAPELERLGYHAPRVVHLTFGAHHPHLPSATHPEWNARNVHELADLVDQLRSFVDRPAPSLSTTLTARGPW
ncbi:serine/threonine-protein kinase [Sandaracinus amylolyticus]|uniref:serine/threonine-protein kinase n=1 Tax=Sandaracinus amylolyticus TaxID=927083 RepID=UPI001F0149B0|nr:protein kinase [Sandaracinus amylolyticus]UJR80159.1 Protein kinase domain-containing protein [Sandaracinus amylolyticus]